LLLLLLSRVPLLQAGDAGVATFEAHATREGLAMLAAGGNAVDAAVTTALVLAVTLPEAGNIGGGGFMVSWMEGEAAFLDFREKAPLAAHRDMFLDDDGKFVQRRSLVGALGIGVPGTVSGLAAAHRRYGRLPWRELVAPAIRLARNGYVVGEDLARNLADASEHFGGDTNFDRYFSGLAEGDRFRQPELAATLERLADDPDDFYSGRIAEQIVAQMGRSRGLITARDLREYAAVWRSPLVTEWRGHTLLLPPPPSSGGIALTQLLLMRDYAAPYFKDVAHNSPRYVHLMAEIEKRVFADRGSYLGDPDFGEVPVAALTDTDYLRRRAAEISVEAISPAEQVLPGLDSRHTSHLSIVDSDGNAVALTYTLNWDCGSGVVVEGAGFLLNNEMDDFSARPGTPNAYGVVGAERNAIEPGKRMLSSMTPTVVLRNDKPVMVTGAMGGSTIFTSVFQVILNVLDFGMDAGQAVAAPRWHHQLPAATELYHDPSYPPADAVVERLTRYGYRVRPNSWGDLGEVMLVLIAPDGRVQAGADPRGRGVARVRPGP
jgi:gamma-glutamyltranspeptidase/glutathione hydrolase